MTNEQMQIRMGEMAAEIERLNAEREQLMAQEPFAYCYTDVNGSAKELCESPDCHAPQDKRIITPLFKEAVLAQQVQPSPAVAVPKFNGWYCAQCQCGVDPSEVTYHETHTVCGRYITDDEPTQSPRITEQDAYAIINSAVNFMYETKSRHSIDYWLFEEGRALLNKLNDKPESVGG